MTKAEILAQVVLLTGKNMTEEEQAKYVKNHTKEQLSGELSLAMEAGAGMEDVPAEPKQDVPAPTEEDDDEQALKVLGMDAKCLNSVLKSARTELGKLKHAINALKSILDESYDFEYRKRNYHGTYRTFLQTAGAFNQNGDLTPASILACCKFKDDKGRACFNKNVTGYVFSENEDKKHDRAYYWATNSKGGHEWKTVRKYMSVPIEDTKWSAILILAVVCQGLRRNTENDAITQSQKDFDAIENVYTFKKQVNKGGEHNRKQAAKKGLVCF